VPGNRTMTSSTRPTVSALRATIGHPSNREKWITGREEPALAGDDISRWDANSVMTVTF